MDVARLHKAKLVAAGKTRVGDAEKDVRAPRGTRTRSDVFLICKHPGLLQQASQTISGGRLPRLSSAGFSQMKRKQT